jgi:Flp pilus assembly protein TadG
VVDVTARLRHDRGNVSLLVVLLIPALITCAGLALDGGRQLQARRDAHAAAASAARAGAQMTPSEAAHGLNPGLAVARAEAELERQGAAGSANVSGNTVAVTASQSVDNLILPGGRTVTGRATADAEQGISESSG